MCSFLIITLRSRPGGEYNTATTFTMRLHPDGTIVWTQNPDYPDQGLSKGRYVIRADEVTFIWDAYTGLSRETVRWSYFDGMLTFAIVDVPDPAGRVNYTAHPWRKIS